MDDNAKTAQINKVAGEALHLIVCGTIKQGLTSFDTLIALESAVTGVLLAIVETEGYDAAVDILADRVKIRLGEIRLSKAVPHGNA